MSLNEYRCCKLCKRECAVDRTSSEIGYCGMSDRIFIARAALHFWEEPIISGTRGSGTIFFSGCSLKCVYCQNAQISRAAYGKEITTERLSEIMLELQQKGAHNINLVTPTHYAPSVKEAVRIAEERNLHLPIVYNTSSYDSIHTIMGLNETVDVYLADLKYVTEKSARELSFVENYPSAAKAAIAEMVKQKGSAVVENGIMRSGVIVRILLLPGKVAEAKLALSYILSEYGDDVYVSLMSQYTPMPNMKPPLDRRVTKREYGELCDYALKKGLQNGFIQEGGAASESFIPPFDMSGI